jgi:hypothetical protein
MKEKILYMSAEVHNEFAKEFKGPFHSIEKTREAAHSFAGMLREYGFLNREISWRQLEHLSVECLHLIDPDSKRGEAKFLDTLAIEQIWRRRYPDLIPGARKEQLHFKKGPDHFPSYILKDSYDCTNEQFADDLRHSIRFSQGRIERLQREIEAEKKRMKGEVKTLRAMHDTKAGPLDRDEDAFLDSVLEDRYEAVCR